jgi:hypothetical protein
MVGNNLYCDVWIVEILPLQQPPSWLAVQKYVFLKA